MQIRVEKGDILEKEADVVIVGCLEGERVKGGALKDVDDALDGQISELLTAGDFKGKHNTAIAIQTLGHMAAKRVVVVGLGKKKALTVEHIRQAVGMGVRKAKRYRAESMALVLVGAGAGEQDVMAVAQAATEAVFLAAYEYDVWKKKDEDAKELQTATIVEKQAGRINRATQGMKLGIVMAEGALHARRLVNEPGQTMRPRNLKEDAERIANLSKRVSVTIYNQEEARKMGMEAFLAVAQGSDEEPYFIHLRYTPKKAAQVSVALVGKGITYDSGGLSLKPSDAMKTMKMDMGGAAAVLGVFSVIDRIAPTVEVHGMIATCENMPSGKAYRPGDIVRAKNGLSIEIDNTDAEGRVTLADSLSFAVEQKPNAIVDMATLTGACMIALGEEIVGLMSNNAKLSKKVFDASNESGEEFWELPLFNGYDKLIESKVADVKNVGSRWGGALTAGLFLRKFVNDIPWVHLDIAGPAFAESHYFSYVLLGGTGVPVRTILQFLRSYR